MDFSNKSPGDETLLVYEGVDNRQKFVIGDGLLKHRICPQIRHKVCRVLRAESAAAARNGKNLHIRI